MILRIGLVAGILDITDAFVSNAFRHITPVMVLQYIASGLMGGTLFDSGLVSAALGIVLHYLIAVSWTAIFFVAGRRL